MSVKHFKKAPKIILCQSDTTEYMQGKLQ